MTVKLLIKVSHKGGAGSGNYGHSGRPGMVGGSGGKGGLGKGGFSLEELRKPGVAELGKSGRIRALDNGEIVQLDDSGDDKHGQLFQVVGDGAKDVVRLLSVGTSNVLKLKRDKLIPIDLGDEE